MAVIGKIREKSYLLLIIIGVAMLAFILGDFFRSGRQFLGEGNEVGEIGDVKITAIEFNNRLESNIRTWESQNNTSANQQVREALTDQTWNDIVREQILESQFSELGITVSPEELFDLIQGNDPHPQVKQAFTDPKTGTFSSSSVLQFLKGLETMPAENRNQWLAFEQSIQKERVGAKYNTLIKKGMCVTSSLAKRTHINQSETRDIRFVSKRYTSVHDSTVSVTPEELKAYYEAHKKEYKQDASRSIEYVRFDVVPSKEDTNKAKKWIDETVEEFKNAQNDSAYVIFNSDQAFDEAYYALSNLPKDVDTSFFLSDQGTVFGPYKTSSSFALAKLSKIKYVPDSVKARHILLKTTQPGDSLVYNKLDSIKNSIEKNGGFADLAKAISEDVGSAIEGGDLGWFEEGKMVKPFSEAAFNGKVGDLVIVESQFGMHLIEILDQSKKARKIQVAKVVRDIVPSNETFDGVFAEASGFYANNKNSADFTKTTEEGEALKRIAEVKINDKTVAGLSSSREMIRWAFNNEKGTVSSPFQFDQTFVVAHLLNVKEDGTASMDDVAIQVEIGAKKKKKASNFLSEMADASNLEELSEKVGETIGNSNAVSSAAYAIPSIGQEPSVLGVISTLSAGQMSDPIEGNTGVFVIAVDKVNEVPKDANYDGVKKQLEQQYGSKSSRVLDALKEKYGVVDQRYKYY